MAYTPHRSVDLREYARILQGMATILERCAVDLAEAEKDEFPGVQLQVETIVNHRIPEVQDWVDDIAHLVKKELRAFATGAKHRRATVVADDSSDEIPPAKPKAKTKKGS